MNDCVVVNKFQFTCGLEFYGEPVNQSSDRQLVMLGKSFRPLLQVLTT